MRVICIDAADNEFSIPHPFGFSLIHLEKYTVIGTEIGIRTGRECFCLAEDNGMGLFFKERFMPVSDIDEKEFERNYNFQTA